MKVVAIGAIYYEINIQLDTSQFNLNVEETITNFSTNIGGSAIYFAKACKELNIDTIIITKVGGDDRAKSISSLSDKDNLKINFICDKTTHTNTAINIANTSGELIMGIDKSASIKLTGDEIESALNNIKDFDFLYLSSILKTPHLLSFWSKYLEKAKVKGLKVILDYGRSATPISTQTVTDLKTFIKKYVDVLLPSREDRFNELMNTKNEAEQMEKASFEFPKTITVIKKDKDGASIYLDNKNITIRTKSGIYNTSVGAGDVFNAGFIYAYYCQSLSLSNAVEFANKTAHSYLETLNNY